MTSFKQWQANRNNARKSTGPITEEGKKNSRCNAVRHGLTAETVIGALEDAEDYRAFEATIIADYDAQSAVERELVLRLASLLWRLRRATAVETGLFEIQANDLGGFRPTSRVDPTSREIVYAVFRQKDAAKHRSRSDSRQPSHCSKCFAQVRSELSRRLVPVPRPTSRIAFCVWPISPALPWTGSVATK